MRYKPHALLVILLAICCWPAAVWAADQSGSALELMMPGPDRPAAGGFGSEEALASDGECAHVNQSITNVQRSEGPCFGGIDRIRQLAEQFHAAEIARRKRIRRKEERERRERAERRRARRVIKLTRCAWAVAERYASNDQRLAMAPLKVKAVICAANEIDAYPYSWAGGHGSFFPGGKGENGGPGYDCSGAVSYALHGGGFLGNEQPNSEGLEDWGESGPGRWITVYTNSGHAWMVVAGVRFDTRNPPPNMTGPRWHSWIGSTEGFIARHPAGY
jgi:hypothetical protein